MDRYHLAKIVDWAGTLKTRKRMQKVVYLLQQMPECPFQADYTLHHYGPYSQEVARLTDEMVQANLLNEETSPNAVGWQYSYNFPESARESLDEYETTTSGRERSRVLKEFLSDKHWLLDEDLPCLEYAATIVFFHKQSRDWSDATRKMCQFKKLKNDSQAAIQAEALACRVLNPRAAV